MKLPRLSRYYYLKFTRLKGDPKSLAMGTAIGVFVGVTPTIPLHTVIILCLSMITRTSAIAAILVSWIVCNPLTYIPIYYFSMVIGNLLTPYELNWPRIKHVITILISDHGFLKSFNEIFNLGFEVIIVMILGGCILALPIALTSYYVSLHIFETMRRKKLLNRQNSENQLNTQD